MDAANKPKQKRKRGMGQGAVLRPDDKRLGAKFWQRRTTHGHDPLYKDPAVLLAACEEYFEWVENNPLWENKVTQFQGGVIDMPVAKMRAMTQKGMCLFLGISYETWRTWKTTRTDLAAVIERVDSVIYTQKFTGAAADLLSPLIIARELGLRDASDVRHSGSVGLTDLSDDELARRLAELEQARANSEQ